MKRIFVVSVMLCALSATAALAQERGNLAIPYRFRLPFLDGGEYVVAASAQRLIRTDKSQSYFDSLATNVNEAYFTTFDMNAVVALTSKFLVAAEFTVYPGSTEANSYFNERETHVAREFTLVYRPVERFEVFAYYFQDTPKWTGYLQREVDTKDIRAGMTYFGKF